ncbi:response regulator [Streptomyces geranii]|uniref:response regulator n=1 Tax=Streptomyces geranii TaxID=2058923 RepID=UPI000D033D16|nr:response regulator [Streptomyces geranii]
MILPDGDGFETYGALRAAGIDAPLLFLTTKDRTEAKVRGPMTGATGRWWSPTLRPRSLIRY